MEKHTVKFQYKIPSYAERYNDPKYSRNEGNKKLVLAKEWFFKIANLVHDYKYTYDTNSYRNFESKIRYTCLEGHKIEQVARSHIEGRGCKYCSGRASNKEIFISNADAFWGKGTFDYSKVEYKGRLKEVTIICSEGHEYKRKPRDHLDGVGCPICSSANRGFTRSDFINRCKGEAVLYLIECFNSTEKFYKVGITSKSIKQRFKDTQKMPYQYEIVKELKGTPEYIYDLEISIKSRIKTYNYKPKQTFSGYSTECFKDIPKEVIDAIFKI